jgi:hypothetical protein
VLFGYTDSYVSFIRGFSSVIIVLRHIDIGCAFEEQWNYAAEIMNERYTSQKPNSMRRLLSLGDFMTYPS